MPRALQSQMAKDDQGRQNALDYEQRRVRRRAAERDRARGLKEDEVQRRRAVRKGQYEATREQMLSTRLQVELNEAREESRGDVSGRPGSGAEPEPTVGQSSAGPDRPVGLTRPLPTALEALGCGS